MRDSGHTRADMLAFKKLLVAAITLLATLTLSACEDNRNSAGFKITSESYSTLSKELNSGGINKIVVDEKTGVEYILIYDGGITPRIDKNGKPVINQQWLKKHEKKELKKKVNRELQKFTVHN